jgi:hypothetical protein
LVKKDGKMGKMVENPNKMGISLPTISSDEMGVEMEEGGDRGDEIGCNA